MVVHELAAERVAELEAELSSQRRAQENLVAASQRVGEQNAVLQHELASLREAKQLAQAKAAALQASFLS